MLIKLYNIILLLLITTAVQAQGYSLVFNAVLKVSQLDTVPAGKVWKVTSAPYKNDAIGTSGGYTQQNPAVEFVQSMFVDGNIVYVQSIRLYDGSWKTFTGPTCEFPLWLPAGTTLQPGAGVRFLSVLEFNLAALP